MGEVTTGAYTYGLPITRRGTHNCVTIGKFCSIAQGVIFDGGFSHNYKNVSTYPFQANMPGCGHLPLNLVMPVLDIVIGNDVWIGEDSLIMAGVTICDGAVIGARSVVTKNVKPFEIVVGHHRSIGFRFPIYQSNKLLEIKWWNWPEDKIRENAHLLLNENIDEFIKRHNV